MALNRDAVLVVSLTQICLATLMSVTMVESYLDSKLCATKLTRAVWSFSTASMQSLMLGSGGGSGGTGCGFGPGQMAVEISTAASRIWVILVFIQFFFITTK